MGKTTLNKQIVFALNNAKVRQDYPVESFFHWLAENNIKAVDLYRNVANA